MFQVIEYIRAFFCGRLGWENLGGTALLPGAFTVFRTSALKTVGGFDEASVTEDFEVLIRMKRHFTREKKPCRFHMIPEPLCWTIVPESWKDLLHQRIRWQRGLIQTLWKHKWLTLNPKGGALTWCLLPYLWLFEAMAPLVDLMAIVLVTAALVTDRLPWGPLLAILAAGLFWGSLITLLSIRFEEKHYARHDPRKSIPRFILYSILENVGYRQFMVLCRILGNFASLRRTCIWRSHEAKALGSEEPLIPPSRKVG